MQRQFTRRAIYEYTQMHFADWFAKLPGYQAFCRRLNRLTPAFRALTEVWMEEKQAHCNCAPAFVVDSCPVILAKQVRSDKAKVGRGWCDKCYNASRKEWYYGVKLHLFARLRPHRLPLHTALSVSSATTCDLWAAKQIMFDCRPFAHGSLFADKAYPDADWADTLHREFALSIVLPRKKGKLDVLISGDTISSAASARRQPIESFFHWLHYKTDFQHASFVRSFSSLFFHIFAKCAAALALLLFYY